MKRLLLVAVLAATTLAPTTASAQDADYEGKPPGLTPAGGATGGTEDGTRQGGDEAAKGTKPGRVRGRKRVRCRTRGQRRICKHFRGKTLVKKCKKKRGARKFKCRKVKPGAATAASFVAANPFANRSLKALNTHGYQVQPTPAVGRIYNSGGGSCSGTLLFRGVVLTAGHCLWGEKASDYYPANTITFTPGNTWDGTQGVTNYGNWGVARTWVTSSWATHKAEGHDFGLMLLNPDANGNYAGDYAGTYPSYGSLALNGNNEIIRMGYPANPPWNQFEWQGGHGQYYCKENFQRVNLNRLNVVWLEFLNACPMNGGSSGGPNFVQFSDGSFGIIGVNNRGIDSAQGWGESAYNIWFDQVYIDFVNAVIAQINGQTASLSRRERSAAVEVSR